MDIASLISSFATGTYSVTRTTRAAYTNRGRASNPTAPSVFSITASVSAAVGNDLKRLPEGRRTQEGLTLYTVTLLTVGGQAEEFEADVVSIDGSPWEVGHVEVWRDPLGVARGYKCILTSTIG